MSNVIELNSRELGIANPAIIHRNLTPAQLTEEALRRGEGKLSSKGALVVKTGKYTGRAAKDKFIVDTPAVHDDINWGNVNKPIAQDVFNKLYARGLEYLSGKEVFVFDGFAGADAKYAKGFRIINELASQNMFIHQLLCRPSAQQLVDFSPDYTVLVVPGMKVGGEADGVNSEAAILLDYEQHKVLIAGTQYAGEIKKSVFSVMNYILPKQGVLPMHCSANVGRGDAGATSESGGDSSSGSDGASGASAGADGAGAGAGVAGTSDAKGAGAGDLSASSAIFFGLSGTGKTTLSADPNRILIGDDEHGWADDSVFNFEGGCYAKCIDLSPEGEPEIYNAIKFGSLVENVVMDDDTREFDFADDTLAVNTRVGYPVDYIPNASDTGKAPVPKTVIFLTADAFGVLPPISKLSMDQAMYYFVSGFTSKVAGTELGITEPVPTFSTCFGEPFMPMHPSVYATMLKDKAEAAGANVYLVNTGWNGTGERTKLKYTRAMVTAALTGEIEKAEFARDPYFGVQVPTSCEGCPDDILIPANTWADKSAYEANAKKLVGMFQKNFEEKYADMPADIVNAGPRVK